MYIYTILSVIFFAFSAPAGHNSISPYAARQSYSVINTHNDDSLRENQILFNGRVWRNLYSMIKEDQFLYSKDFLPGSVTMVGVTFKDVPVRYDIYDDQIITATNHGLILQLNKEMVDSFSVNFQNTIRRFIKFQEDSSKVLKGYVNVLYSGKSALYVKYKKEIEFLALENKYDMFYQTQKIYFVKDNVAYGISGRGDFYRILGDNKKQVRSFMKKYNLIISRNNPESFVPAIKFYDSLK